MPRRKKTPKEPRVISRAEQLMFAPAPPLEAEEKVPMVPVALLMHQQAQKIMATPALAGFVPRILALIKQPIMQGMNAVLERQTQHADLVLKLIFATLTLSSKIAAVPKHDAILLKALKDRILYAANLNAIHARIARDMSQHVGEASEALFQPSSLPEWMDMVSSKRVEDISIKLATIHDYLPANKFHSLLIDPHHLWNKQRFNSYKQKEHNDEIRSQLIDYIPLLQSHEATLNQIVELIKGLHRQMIPIYELMAESDRLLLAHCAEKGYTHEWLFEQNKACVLEVLTTVQNHVAQMDIPKKEVQQELLSQHIEWVSRQASWTNMDSDVRYKQVFFEEAQDLMTSIRSNVINDYMMTLIQAIDVTALDNLVVDLSQVEVIRSLFGLGVFIPDFLLKQQSATILADIRPHFEKLRRFQSDPQKIRSWLEPLMGSLQGGSLFGISFNQLIKPSRHERLTLSQQLNQSQRPDLLLLEVLKKGQDKEVLHCLKQSKKDDPQAQFMQIVPENNDDQLKFLTTIIASCNPERGSMLPLLKELLTPRYPWNNKVIKKLKKNKLFHPDIRALFTERQSPPQMDSNPPVEAADRLPEDEEKSTLSDLKQLSAAGISCLKTRGFFPQSRSQQVLDTHELALKIQLYTELFHVSSPQMQNACCHALTFIGFQFFQAYTITPDVQIAPLEKRQALQIRNAFVHPHAALEPNSRALGFVLDGKQEALMQFVGALKHCIHTEQADDLVVDPLFTILLRHGIYLEQEWVDGRSEQDRLCDCIRYNMWLDSGLKSIHALQKTSNGDEVQSAMLHDASMMLHILQQVYCLRGAGKQSIAYDAFYKSIIAIRHSTALLQLSAPSLANSG